MTELMLPVGRLVGGHPMKRHPVVDDRTTPPTKVMQADGVTPATDMWAGIAVPKGPETDWRQTEWGQKIYKVGVDAWPNGEHGAPTFSWKITDGDSVVPNQKGVAPNTREGYPGHWIVGCSTQFNVECYHVGRVTPHEQIRNENEIKAGDYCQLFLDVVGNNIKKVPKSPGIYINPKFVQLVRAGIAIQLGTGTKALDAFGGAAPQMPAGALIDTAVAAGAPPINTGVPGTMSAPPINTAVATPPPHNTFINGPGAQTPPPPIAETPIPPVPENYVVNGVAYTRASLETAGYTPEVIATLPRA